MRRARRAALPLAAAALALLAGCASSPRPGRDGAPASPPADLAQRPDAVPRIEPLRIGGPNKPYEVLGRRYVPLTSDAPLQENGLASWYGTKFHGQSTANGETYDMYAMTAAHKTMPLPSYARVRNPANGREIIVRVNDRGPFADGRVIDLSYTAALKLGVLRGVAPVQVQRLTFDDIRGGRWREGRGETIAALPPAASPVADDLAPGDSGAVDAGFWLQLGAFRSRDSALRLRQQLLDDPEAAFPAVAVFEQNGWYRVQAGPYATRGMAQQAAQAGLRQAGPDTLIVERGPSLGR